MLSNEREAYHIRHYQPGDEAAIAKLFNLVFGAPLTIEQWRWKYVGASAEMPQATLAFDSAGQLVSHAGAISLRGWRRGQSLPFFQICDVMVHPAARGSLGDRNLFAQVVRHLLSSLADRWPDLFAYGFPGRRPFRLGERLRIYGAVEQAQSLRRPARSPFLPLLRTQPLNWNDPRLDVLWTHLASGFPLTLVRDRAYLIWRYANNPFRSYQLLGLYLAGRLLGWAVVRRDDNRLCVIDLLIARRWLKPALTALDQAALTAGVTESEIWLPPRWRKTANGHTELTEVVIANMIWRLPLSTTEVSNALYYAMGDLDIF